MLQNVDPNLVSQRVVVTRHPLIEQRREQVVRAVEFTEELTHGGRRAAVIANATGAYPGRASSCVEHEGPITNAEQYARR